jgi:hypothetical protein
MHLYYLDIWSVVDAMWSCLYGFVLDILCVKHIICTLNYDMRNMSKFSIFSVIPSQNKIFLVHKQRISPSGHRISVRDYRISVRDYRISFFEFEKGFRSDFAKFGPKFCFR